MAGAADELQEALLVNPFAVDEVTDALHRALSMPVDERHARMSALRHRVRANDVRAWVARFLDATERAALRARSTVASPADALRSEEHTSELQSRLHLVCRLLLEKKKMDTSTYMVRRI